MEAGYGVDIITLGQWLPVTRTSLASATYRNIMMQRVAMPALVGTHYTALHGSHHGRTPSAQKYHQLIDNNVKPPRFQT